jgi:hypothetical protein
MGESDEALRDLQKRARIRALRKAAGPEFLFMGFANDEAKAIAREFHPPAATTPNPVDAPTDQNTGNAPAVDAGAPVDGGAEKPPTIEQV